MTLRFSRIAFGIASPLWMRRMLFPSFTNGTITRSCPEDCWRFIVESRLKQFGVTTTSGTAHLLSRTPTGCFRQEV